MIHFVLPLVLIGTIKAFFLAHGLSISMAAARAGYNAHKNNEDVVKAAINAGATEAAAQLLRNALRKYC